VLSIVFAVLTCVRVGVPAVQDWQCWLASTAPVVVILLLTFVDNLHSLVLGQQLQPTAVE
jgi:hypothetical protein